MLNDKDFEGNMALHLAAESCHPQILRLILSKSGGVNVNNVRKNRENALHLACKAGSLEEVENCCD